MSVLQKLTEGIKERSLQREGAALLDKWEATGLLEGLDDDTKKNGMARLLENQASQLLKEASSMAAGDVEGFASVAFPLVRRVFGGLLANDLVSVQPMSLPSGLIFFLDFSYETARLGVDEADSIYGGGVLGSQITGGVSDITETGGGMYNMANAYSSPTGSIALADGGGTAIGSLADNSLGDKDMTGHANPLTVTPVAVGSLSEPQKRSLRFDADVLALATATEVWSVVVKLSSANMATVNLDALPMCTLVKDDFTALEDGTGDLTVIRRLTHLGYRNALGAIVADSENQHITFYVNVAALDGTGDNDIAATATFRYPIVDAFAAGQSVGAVTGQDNWGLEEPTPQTGNVGKAAGKQEIPEIDIQVDSVAVTAITKKLKAKWSPELGQDLNAYHNLDAEVELTGILSEHIALEIDREILNDLVQGATAGTYYWSRSPGLFVNRTTGVELGALSAAPDFTGTVSEWYETLVETINDVSAQIHRKTLRGGANFLVTSPEVANILEFTAGFRASVTADADRGTVGAVKTGSMSKKWDVFVDPYFPRNIVLVGRRGGSFLESGYVYAPYVPLQVTPTIFGTEDFVPRKGVMTRYAKKMVRPDMYGVVIVRGLLGEAGATS
jgi:hypothetical protein